MVGDVSGEGRESSSCHWSCCKLAAIPQEEAIIQASFLLVLVSDLSVLLRTSSTGVSVDSYLS